MKKFLLILLASASVSLAEPQFAHAQAGGGNPAPNAEAQVSKLQWRRPADTADQYQDVSGPLYVVKDTTLIFRAIKDVDTKPWPSGKPSWSGTAGATGTGETMSVAFATVSTTATDYKTVVAQTIATDVKTANVVVCSVTATTKSDDDFTGHSTSSFGITEAAKCNAVVAPSGVTPNQIGTMEWTKGGGTTGSLGATANGVAQLVCGTTNESLNLNLKITSGPSKDKNFSLARSVVQPNAGFVDQQTGTNVRHVKDVYSAGFKGDLSIGPKDVSFKDLGFREGTIPNSATPPARDTTITGNVDVRSTATGWFDAIGANNWPHMMGGPTVILSGSTGNKSNGTDTIDTGNLPVGAVSPYDATKTIPAHATGNFNWPITWFFQPPGGSWTYFVTMNHTMLSDATGKATIQKGGTTKEMALSAASQNF